MATILVVDDDAWVLKIFKQILQSEGYKVLSAENGQQAIDVYRQNKVDLVITDMVMPVKDGLKMIMELEKEFPGVLIIAVSGGGAIEPERYLSLAETIGTKITLTKPVNKKDLLSAVSEVLAA